MNSLRFPLLLSFFVLGVFVASASAETKWSLPNLNPFSQAGSKPASKPSSPRMTNPLKMPKINLSLPKIKSKPPKRSSQPSTWDKFSQGTKDFFGKTKDVLTPGDDTRKRSVGPKQEKESFFSKLLPAKEEPPRRPRTPAEFLAQPRPR